jgi:hypothetical protein
MLVTDPRSKIAAYDEQTNASGMIQGMGLENKLAYAFVSHLHRVALADMIFSSGEGIVYPRGFLIGKISNLFGTDGLHHRIDVEPAVDYHAIEYCYVLQKGAEYCAQAENMQEASLAHAQKVSSLQATAKPVEPPAAVTKGSAVKLETVTIEQRAVESKISTHTVAEKTTWQKIFAPDKPAKPARQVKLAKTVKEKKDQKEKLSEQTALADNNKPVEIISDTSTVAAVQPVNTMQAVAVQEAVPVEAEVEQNSVKQEPA